MKENSLSRSIPPRQMIVISSAPARALTTGRELVRTVRSAAAAQGAGSLQDGRARAEEDRFPGLHERRGSLPDADFFVGLFVLALQDGLFGGRLGQDDRAAMDALEFAQVGERLQVAPGGGFTDIERGANFRHADALLAVQQLQDLLLAVCTGDKIGFHNRS